MFSTSRTISECTKLQIKSSVNELNVQESRKPKIKAAVMLGFKGSNYQGMQLNPGANTIESVLFDALCKVGAISKSNAVDPRKVGWVRCARTDRGVHAACNIVSLKIIRDPDLVNKLNNVLPKDIRIWGYEETPRGFHAKNQCDSRIYEYLLPTYTLRQRKNPIVLKDQSDSPKDIKIMTKDSTVLRYATPDDSCLLSDYRLDQKRLGKFREAMLIFEGTHNFHNYTISKGLQERSIHRHLKSIKVSDPKVIYGMEWVSIKLHGSSFMLHQIRKMISMAMLCVYTNAPLSLIQKSFEKDKLNIPKAPSLGLLLDRPVYQYYNEKVTSLGNKKPIDFDLYKTEIEKFKQEEIYSSIFKQEYQTHVFEDFLVNVDAHLPCDYSYFNVSQN